MTTDTQLSASDTIKTHNAINTIYNNDIGYFFDNIKTRLVNSLSSVKLTIVLLSLLGCMVLLGAWCPQISQAGQSKVIEQFGEQTADFLIKIGIADIFHSIAFLLLISLITVNIIFGSFRHVFPKLKLLKIPMPWLNENQISKLPVNYKIKTNTAVDECQNKLVSYLSKAGYSVRIDDTQITAESGKFGRLAPTVTHIGLLTLLTGVIFSSWTGFSGFKPVIPGKNLTFADSEHSYFWFGKLPKWSARVNETHREDYTNGEAKQWYSNLSVLDKNGKVLKQQTISVNEPLSYDGVDIYQSSWGLKSLKIRFNNELKELSLQPMGKLFAAFLPLPQKSVIIFSVRDTQGPLRIFAKREDWSAPKLLSQIGLKESTKLGDVSVTYDGTIAQTGLQYKCDPGLPVVFLAFTLLICGISLAAVPHRQIWAQLNMQTNAKDINNTYASLTDNSTIISIGGNTKKGKISFARQIEKIMDKVKND